MSSQDLNKKVSELKKKLSDMRFKIAGNQVKNVKEAGNIRKEVARMLTMLNEKK